MSVYSIFFLAIISNVTIPVGRRCLSVSQDDFRKTITFVRVECGNTTRFNNNIFGTIIIFAKKVSPDTTMLVHNKRYRVPFQYRERLISFFFLSLGLYLRKFVPYSLLIYITLTKGTKIRREQSVDLVLKSFISSLKGR